MKIETKYNIGDVVVFDEDRIGEIIGIEYQQLAGKLQYTENGAKYQIMPLNPPDKLYGDMRKEKDICLYKS